MRKKQFYEAPEAELFLVRFEESFLTGTNGYGDPGKAGSIGNGNVYSFDDDPED